MTRTGEAAEPTSVVQVRIDSQVPHLDRPFDYLVPASLTESVEVGSRVRVRFAGRLMTAYVVATDVTTDHPGELRPIERAMGPEPVLTDDTLKLVQAVAERWAGTFSDVVRSAVPPRHARAEKVNVSACTWRSDPGDSESGDSEPGDAAWSDYGAGPALLRRLAESGSAEPIRAVWSLAPATDWSNDVAGLTRAVTSMETGSVIVVVPDAADVDRVLAAIPEAVTARAVATLTADMGPERRYREFARILRGGVRIVVGTRGSVFAPVPDLRLIVVWDDGDDSLVDPQAPYWNARDVAALRSHLSGCSLVVGSASRTVVTQQWCETGWAKSVVSSKETVSSRAPKVRAITEQDEARDPAAAAARMPHTAWVAARAARSGPSSRPVQGHRCRRSCLTAWKSSRRRCLPP